MILVEKEFAIDKKNENFYIDAFDIATKLIYRFVYEANLSVELIEIQIDPLIETLSLSDCIFIDGNEKDLFEHVKKHAKTGIEKVYEAVQKEIESLEEKKEEEKEAENSDILLI